MYIKFALFIILWSISSESYTSSTSASQWITTESQSSSKWCRNSSNYTSGYSCTSSDTSAVWGGDSNYRWSSETSNLPQNSKKLLCPVDTTYWNTLL